VLLSGLVSRNSAAQRIVDAVSRRRFVPLVSSDVMTEYHRVLIHPVVRDRFPRLSLDLVAKVLLRMRYLADVIDTRSTHFLLPRDPLDAKFIELAIAGRATHLISLDDDILSLQESPNDAGRRFRQRLPHLVVQRPAEFVEDHLSDV
jgi:putative PIN family toxin of toxin-antitoxin system